MGGGNWGLQGLWHPPKKLGEQKSNKKFPD